MDLNTISAHENWIVAQVIAQKPYATIPGGYIDGNTGRLVAPRNSHLIRFVHGSVKTVVQLSASTASTVDYKWQWNIFDPEERRFSPFRSGGVVVMRVNKQSSDAAQFQPVYLIPDRWVSFVEPAVKSVQAKAEMLKPKTASAHRKELEVLLSDANPFVAIAAAHTLEQAQLLDANFIQNHLLSSVGWERSVFTNLVLQQLPANKDLDLPDAPLTNDTVNDAVSKALQGEPLADALGQFIDNAKDAVTLYYVALGLYAAPQHTNISMERVKRLLQRVDARQKALGTHTEADASLDLLVKTTGVLQSPVAPREVPHPVTK